MAALPETRQRAIGSLTVDLVKAILPKTDATGKCDPYVVLTVGKQTFKTEKQKNTLRPQWDLKFQFDVNSEADVLKIECFDWDCLSKNDLVGEGDVPYESFRRDQTRKAPETQKNEAPFDYWVELQKAGKAGESRGRILFKLEFEDYRMAAEHLANAEAKARSNSLISRSTFVETPPTPRNSLAVSQRGSRDQNADNLATNLAKLKEHAVFDTSGVEGGDVAKPNDNAKEEKRRDEAQRQGDGGNALRERLRSMKPLEVTPEKTPEEIVRDMSARLSMVRQRPLNLDSSSEGGSDVESYDSAEEVDLDLHADSEKDSHIKVKLRQENAAAMKRARNKISAANAFAEGANAKKEAPPQTPGEALATPTTAGSGKSILEGLTAESVIQSVKSAAQRSVETIKKQRPEVLGAATAITAIAAVCIVLRLCSSSSSPPVALTAGKVVSAPAAGGKKTGKKK